MSHNKGSDKSKSDLYDSGRADSGFISGALTSESLFSGEISPDESPAADSRPSRSEYDVGEDMSKDYKRLDSGVDLTYRDLSSRMSGVTIEDVQTPSIEIDAPTLHKAFNIDESSWQLYFEQDEEGDTQLHIAIIHRFTEVVFNLVRLVPSSDYLNIRNDARQTALHLAVLTSQPQVVRRLIVAGADPTILNCKGNTPLHLATEAGDLACVRALTEKVELQEVHRAQLRYKPSCPSKVPLLADMVNYEGQTAVHLAALNGHIGILKYLVKCGADIDAREGKAGQTVLHMAAESSNCDLAVFLLRELMAEPNMPNYAGLTAYHVGRRNPQFLKTLLDYGVHADSDYFSSDDDDDEDDAQLDNSFRDQFQGRLINAV